MIPTNTIALAVAGAVGVAVAYAIGKSAGALAGALAGVLAGSAAVLVLQLLARRAEEARILPFTRTPAQARISTEVVFENLRQISSLECADFNGAVFVRDSLPLRLLGIKLAEADLWMSTPGVVRAAVDLSTLDPASVRDVSAGGRPALSILLPDPEIVSVEIHPEDGTRGRSPMLFLGGNADAVATAEDRLCIEAERQLREQAERMGILEKARDNARVVVTDAVRQLLGDPSISVEIEFEGDFPARSGQQLYTPDWRLAG